MLLENLLLSYTMSPKKGTTYTEHSTYKIMWTIVLVRRMKKIIVGLNKAESLLTDLVHFFETLYCLL